jgi:recombination protein RecR
MNTLEHLMQVMSKLPGLGPRSARRTVLHLLKNRETTMRDLTTALSEAMLHVKTCSTCGALDSQSPCGICLDSTRDPHVICVVEDVADLWAIERCQTLRGLYHVLGGTLSAMDGIGPDQLHIPRLIQRVVDGDIREVVLATNATLEGQTTAHYIAEKLKPYAVTVTRLAYGIPVGGELDYLDDGTLHAALHARLSLQDAS